MNHVIYGLRDPRTKEIRYIGKTNNPKKRLSGHLRDARHGGNFHVHRWIRTLIDRDMLPEVVILESEISSSSIDAREIWWISEGKRQGWKLTNITEGGDGGAPFTGKTHSIDTRTRMSVAHRGQVAWNKGIPSWNKGKPMTKKHRENISIASKGKIISPETREKIGAANRGKYRPPDATARAAASNRGKRRTAEQRAKIGAASKGRTHTAESRAKIAAALIGNKNKKKGKQIAQEQLSLFGS